jgi:hypothetical protein
MPIFTAPEGNRLGEVVVRYGADKKLPTSFFDEAYLKR